MKNGESLEWKVKEEGNCRASMISWRLARVKVRLEGDKRAYVRTIRFTPRVESATPLPHIPDKTSLCAARWKIKRGKNFSTSRYRTGYHKFMGRYSIPSSAIILRVFTTPARAEISTEFCVSGFAKERRKFVFCTHEGNSLKSTIFGNFPMFQLFYQFFISLVFFSLFD